MVFNRNSSTVGRILMFSSADPHEILILIKWWKISPLARLQVRARKICIMRIVDFGQFWPIFAQKCFGFRDGKFFPVMGNTWNFQGSISTARGTFEPKTHPSPPILPHFLAKAIIFRVQKYPKKWFFWVFVKRPIKPLGKIFRTQKQIVKILFPLGATSKKNTP